MSGKKHILLVSYVFPPYHGIGGRRWAKHADALTKIGYTIDVICAKNPFDEQSLWTETIQKNPKITVHILPAKFPSALVNFRQNLLQKISYKFWNMILPRLYKGSIYDRTIFWKKPMLKKAEELISKHGIRHVICSGAPFGALYYTTILKQKFPQLFILNDLRDPWTWGPNWGFPTLSPERMKFESEREYCSIRDADVFTVPTEEMKLFLDNKYPKFSEKIKVIPHFFDKEEITVLPKTPSEKLRFIYYGTIYHHISELIDEVAKVFPEFNQKITLDIYTDNKDRIHDFEKYGAKNIRFFKPRPATELFQLFCDYDFVFLMIPSVGVHHISTKFFEIIYSRTPFFAFSVDGKGPAFITENNVGVHARPGELRKKIVELMGRKSEITFNTNMNVEIYSLENNAKLIDSLLQNSN